jgi:hypothetical protein
MGTKELNADLDEILKQQHIVEGAAAERERIVKILVVNELCCSTKEYQICEISCSDCWNNFLKDGDGE